MSVKKFQVAISEQLVEELSGIAVEFNVDSVETLVDAMLREKVFGVTGRKVPSLVRLTQQAQDKKEEDLSSNLRQAVANTGIDTYNPNLGPNVEQAPEQYTNAFMDQQVSAGTPNMQPDPMANQQMLNKIAQQDQQIRNLNSLVHNMQQQQAQPPMQGGNVPFGQRQR